MKTLPISIGVATALMAPIWVQHLASKDGGMLAIGGGKITEADIFGDRKTPAMHPMIFHVLAIAGVAHFTLSAMAIAGTALGDATTKKFITAIYAAWVSTIAVLQYTHPWTGSAPDNFFDMPMPLVLVIGGLLSVGMAMDDSGAKVKSK